MKFPWKSIVLILALVMPVLSCMESPPHPGQEMTLKEHAVHLKLADGWSAEIPSEDWTMWTRVKKGRGEEPWVIAPITATQDAAPHIQWRFKGVSGKFDPQVNPLTSSYPVPKGLWSLDPQKLDLLETETKTLPWGSMSDIQATCRLYENTHGADATATIAHTYTVTFNAGPNAYEFVMSIPDTAKDYHDWINTFWGSIADFSMDKK